MSDPEKNDPSSETAETATNNVGGGADFGEAPSSDGSAGSSDVAAQLASAKAEAAANYDKFMRSVADLENFRRRAVREKDELRALATSRVLEDIFPVLDNLALAVQAGKQPNADIKSLVGGVDMVLTQLKSALASHGLKEINPVGQTFDPHQHEAISHEPSASVKEEHVLSVVRTGYSLNGRLLRPASVVVSSGPNKA